MFSVSSTLLGQTLISKVLIMVQYFSKSECVLGPNSRLWFQRCGATFDQNPERRNKVWKVGAVSIRLVYLCAENKAREEQERPGPLVPGWQRCYHDAVVALHWKELVLCSAGSHSQWLPTAAHPLCVSVTGGANPEIGKLQCGSLLRTWKFPQNIQKIPKDVEAK